MTEFAIHTIDSAPAASQEILKTVAKKYGFVPNLLGELSAAPVALTAYLTLNDLLAKTTFTAVEQQLILAATSIANSCEYCVAAHSAGLKMAGFADDELDALRSGRRRARHRRSHRPRRGTGGLRRSDDHPAGPSVVVQQRWRDSGAIAAPRMTRAFDERRRSRVKDRRQCSAMPEPDSR